MRSDGFCDEFCHEVPKFPPPQFKYVDTDDYTGIGKPSTVPVKPVKLYQFEQEWRGKSISESAVRAEAFKALADAEMLTSPGEDEELTDELSEQLFQLLSEMDEATILEVEPTAWDLDHAARDSGSYLRVGAGRWLAVGDLGTTGVALLLALLALMPAFGAATAIAASTFPAAAKSIFKGVNFFKALVGALVLLPEGSVDREVFESLYKLGRQLQVVDYDAKKNRVFGKAYDFKPPTTKEIAEDIHRRESEVRLVLYGLKDRNVLKNDRDRDTWSIRF